MPFSKINLKSLIIIMLILVFNFSPLHSYERNFETHPVIKIIKDTKKIIAISDIHGAIFQFIATLKEAGIIEQINQKIPVTEKEILKIQNSTDFNKYFKYTGIDTTIVIAGDLVSRGYFSREVIDLVIFLQTEAVKQGGQVVTIPGNHEVRILTGDIEKLQKYEQYEFVVRSFNRSGKNKDTDYKHMISKKGVYGKWLRELPMAAIVNDVFFIHAGLKPGQDLQTIINEYGDSIIKDDYESEVFNGKSSPMWIRKTGKKKSKLLWWENEEEFLQILKNVKCNYMVVGHDPGGLGKKGLIGFKYNRLFNIDVGMTPDKGYSMGGALIIESINDKTIFTALESDRKGFFYKYILLEKSR